MALQNLPTPQSAETSTVLGAFTAGFLGAAPAWYKQTILVFLIINPVALYVVGPFVTGWLILAQFILTLAMALK